MNGSTDFALVVLALVDLTADFLTVGFGVVLGGMVIV